MKSETLEAEPYTSSLLYMQWKVDHDILDFYRGADKEVPNKITKQPVLSFVASLFDPLGHFAAFTMRLLILLEKCWSRTGQQWDDKIDNEDEDQFLHCVGELDELKYLPLKRPYFDESFKKLDLQFFSDASLVSMCIVA